MSVSIHPSATAPTARAALLRTSALALVLASLPLAAGSAATFQVTPSEEPSPGIVTFSGTPTGISADGRIVVGSYVGPAYWDSTGVRTDLPSAGVLGSAVAVNADGTIIVGGAFQYSTENTIALKWVDGETEVLPDFGGGSQALGVSGDGSSVVGYAAGEGNQVAVRWDAEGINILDHLTGETEAMARGVSADGSVIVGYAIDESYNRTAVYWDSSDIIHSLAFLDSGNNADLDSLKNADAVAASNNGSVIVGSAFEAGTKYAVYWDAARDVHRLALADGMTSARATAVNGDGSVIVGTGQNFYFDGIFLHDTQSGFRWTQDDGVISVGDWLRNNGVDVAVDIAKTAIGVSADGDVVVGQSQNGMHISRGFRTPAPAS
ncbi:putative membrane protein [Hoeflea marina]|uniref:Putative membrane protein n=1 Tax=Hoeflea marina TaxID=274592 RepID=A0A317PPL9_9HYPH|nr:hypothetical protein [Hoeflea marina]PWW03373.1 putative membrane protein [Hoeflea marina]